MVVPNVTKEKSRSEGDLVDDFAIIELKLPSSNSTAGTRTSSENANKSTETTLLSEESSQVDEAYEPCYECQLLILNILKSIFD